MTWWAELYVRFTSTLLRRNHTLQYLSQKYVGSMTLHYTCYVEFAYVHFHPPIPQRPILDNPSPRHQTPKAKGRSGMCSVRGPVRLPPTPARPSRPKPDTEPGRDHRQLSSAGARFPRRGSESVEKLTLGRWGYNSSAGLEILWLL